MNIKKIVIGCLVGVAVLMGGIITAPMDVQAQVIEKDANPVKMVFTSWGGICLERQGQEKFFKVWDKDTNKLTNLGIPTTNIQSFDVDGRNLVYIRHEGSGAVAYLYNIDTKKSVTLDNTYCLKKNIAIDGNNVVWEDYRDGKGDIALYNLTSGKVEMLENNYFDQTQPAIFGNHIAYIDGQNGHKSIYIYDLNSGKSTLIRDTENDKSSLALYGNKLVWSELRDGSEGASDNYTANSYFDELWGYTTRTNAVYDLWFYDLNTGVTKQLTNDTINQLQPALWGNYLAWVDTGKGNPDIKLMDLNSYQVSTITTSDAYDVQPSLGYGYISWVAMRGNMGDLNIQALSSEGFEQPGEIVPEDIKVIINGHRYFMNPSPYIKNDRTMVPMRRIFEILGAQVSWNETERSVTATRGQDTVKLYIGNKVAYRNGNRVELDAAPEIMLGADRTMIPLRFVSEALGCQVGWDDINRTVNISNSWI